MIHTDTLFEINLLYYLYCVALVDSEGASGGKGSRKCLSNYLFLTFHDKN